jgi:hypothetical protein
MRIARAVTLLIAFSAGGPLTLRGQAPDAAHVLAAAREALGGEKTLASVKTFVATGRTRQIRGNNLVPIEFEMTCELPDKFVRRDEVPAQDTDITVAGFRGEELIQFPPAPAPAPAQAPAPSVGRGGAPPRLTTVKQDFARLMLGVFAASFPPYPLTFTYAAEGEAPEGKADILDVAGPANFAARLIVQRDTHLPVMLMWQQAAPPAIGRGRGPGPGAATPNPPATPSEFRMYFADYRSVNGLKWPFRIRRAVAGNTIEETTFDRVSINVKIDPRKFEAPK